MNIFPQVNLFLEKKTTRRFIAWWIFPNFSFVRQ